MKLRMILIALSLMAFLSAWTGGYLYYSSIKNSALEEYKVLKALDEKRAKVLYKHIYP